MKKKIIEDSYNLPIGYHIKNNIIYINNFKSYYTKFKPPYIEPDCFKKSIQIQSILAENNLSPNIVCNKYGGEMTNDNYIYFVQTYYGQTIYQERTNFYKKKYTKLIDKLSNINEVIGLSMEKKVPSNLVRLDEGYIEDVQSEFRKEYPYLNCKRITDLLNFPSNSEIEMFQKSLVHGDLHLGNILSGNNGLKLIDFDESFYGYKILNYAYFFSICNLFNNNNGLYEIDINYNLKKNHINKYMETLNKSERKYLFSFVIVTTIQIVFDLSYEKFINPQKIREALQWLFILKDFFPE